MLSHLDDIIYPDRCEVIETPSQRYVYVIYKNGYSSLNKSRINKKWRTLFNEQIRRLDNIDVILRDPDDRFLSGINTYLQYLLKDNPSLDPDTALWFAKNYLFLNRHYCLQFSWLLNLARYAASDAKFNFIGMEDLDTITGINAKPEGIDPASLELREKLKDISALEIYHRIDRCLYDCIGQSLTFAETLGYIRDQDTDAYDKVIGKSIRLSALLHVLPKT